MSNGSFGSHGLDETSLRSASPRVKHTVKASETHCLLILQLSEVFSKGSWIFPFHFFFLPFARFDSCTSQQLQGCWLFFFFFPCSSVQQPTSRSPGCMLMIALEKDRLKIKWILVQSYFCFIGESSRKKMNKKLLLQLPLKIKLGNLLCYIKHRTNERPPSSPPLGEAHQL